MKNKYLMMAVMGAAALTCVLIAKEVPQQFIVKKPKRVTTTSLKEQIGASYGSMLKKLSQLIVIMADCNQELVERTGELLDDQCSATAAQLQKYLDELATFEKKLDEFQSNARYMHDCLQDGLPGKKTS